jgi:hypothetical protein
MGVGTMLNLQCAKKLCPKIYYRNLTETGINLLLSKERMCPPSRIRRRIIIRNFCKKSIGVVVVGVNVKNILVQFIF